MPPKTAFFGVPGDPPLAGAQWWTPPLLSVHFAALAHTRSTAAPRYAPAYGRLTTSYGRVLVPPALGFCRFGTIFS